MSSCESISSEVTYYLVSNFTSINSVHLREGAKREGQKINARVQNNDRYNSLNPYYFINFFSYLRFLVTTIKTNRAKEQIYLNCTLLMNRQRSNFILQILVLSVGAYNSFRLLICKQNFESAKLHLDLIVDCCVVSKGNAKLVLHCLRDQRSRTN